MSFAHPASGAMMYSSVALDSLLTYEHACLPARILGRAEVRKYSKEETQNPAPEEVLPEVNPIVLQVFKSQGHNAQKVPQPDQTCAAILFRNTIFIPHIII